MNVLIIGFTKMAYMPYMNFYIEQLRKNNNTIHLLYWERDSTGDIEVPLDVIPHCFKKSLDDSIPLKNKISSFLAYRKFAVQILESQNFDLLIVLHTTPGVILNDLLFRYYKKKYILDYRDFTYENFKVYKYVINKLVNNSSATFVSSNAYKKYLPEKSFVHTSHNILVDSLEKRYVRKQYTRERKVLRIRFWGLIRHKDSNLNLINSIGNDSRFELHYHGREQNTGEFLKSYCKENKIKNVFFHGEYKPIERYNFAKETEIIHNIFDNDKTMKPAISNKYYDGITFYIPQLCSEGSFLGEQVITNNIGQTINTENENVADTIYYYYKNIDWGKFQESCDVALTQILNEYNEGINKVIEISKEGRNLNV